jgi:hypothetical protein
VSKHLFLLKNARLIVGRKDGRWMHYRLNNKQEAPSLVVEALEWIVKSVSDDPVIKADRDRLVRFLWSNICNGLYRSCLGASTACLNCAVVGTKLIMIEGGRVPRGRNRAKNLQ